VTYVRKLGQRYAFFGDTVQLGIEVRNRKPLPVWLKCEDEVPEDIVSQGHVQPHYKYGRAVLINKTIVGGYETVKRRFLLNCRSRGVFSLGPVILSSKDPIGLYQVYREDPAPDLITVFPRYVPVDKKLFKILSPFGDFLSRSWIHQDPSIFKGTREYQPGDPINRLHWKNAAKTGTLHTRTFESTSEPKVVICLNLSTSEHVWEGVNQDLFEGLITAAASLAVALSERGFSVGLVSNGVSKGEQNENCLVAVPPSRGGSSLSGTHLRRILSSLAGTGYLTFEGFRAACRKPWIMSKNVFKIVVTAILNDEVMGLLSDLTSLSPKDLGSSTILAVLRTEASQDTDVRAISEALDLGVLNPPGRFAYKTVIARLSGGWLKADKLEIEDADLRRYTAVAPEIRLLETGCQNG